MTDNIHPSKAPECARIQYWGRHVVNARALAEGLLESKLRRERAQRRWSWLLRLLGVL